MKRVLALVGLLVVAALTATAAATPATDALRAATSSPTATATQHHSGTDETITIAGAGLDSLGAARCHWTVTYSGGTVENNVTVNPDGTFTVLTKKFKPTGPYTLSVSCTDAGGFDVGSFSGTLTPIAPGDGTPVTLTFTAAPPAQPVISAPVDGATYVQNKVLAARYKCPNVPSCVGTVANGADVDTSTVGSHTFTVTATSSAGLAASKTVTYHVVYAWNGFSAPVTNTESQKLNEVDAGDLVKVAFWVEGDNGLGIVTGASPPSHAIACPDWPTHTIPPATSNVQPGLQQGDTASRYVYGFQTRLDWAGTCRRFEVDLADGTSHTADFEFPTVTPIDLESLTVAQAGQMMDADTLTSVQLTQAYLNRIAALNTHGPSLNAVRALNPAAMSEADAADARRRAGNPLGAMDGMPILLKDNVDVVGMPTTAGSIPLEHSMPPVDSTVAANLKAAGAVILGKTNLSEFANFITNTNPSGYSGVGGQVLAAVDADLNPSGSSSGSGTAAAAALAMVTIGTETSGSIISPSLTEGDVGLRPTVGLVSRFGIVPISASQDTAGPITRNVADAAAVLQAIAGPDMKDHSPTLWGPGVDDSLIVPPQPLPVPNYLAALNPNALSGAHIGFLNNTDATAKAAITALVGPTGSVANISTPATVGNNNQTALLDYEFHRDLNNYLAHLGPAAPVPNLAGVIAANNANPLEAIKFGQTELTASQAQNSDDLNSAQSVTYRTNLVAGKTGNRANIDNALASNGGLDAIVGPAGSMIAIGARAGYPEITVNAGYSATNRQPQNVQIAFAGTKYTEAKLIGFAYAYEQATHLRQPSSLLDPSMYRCADTVPPPPFASRGGCAPSHDDLMAMVGTPPTLPSGLRLESASAKQLSGMLTAGTLTSVALTKAYLQRIAVVNTQGPGIDAVRSVNPNAIADAAASDALRTGGHSRGPLEGLPVLISDDIDVNGLPTTDGSVALQNSMPSGDSKLVANLRAAGAIVLGKTNTTELSGWMSTNMPPGYSSLGGQVLDPYDTDARPSGSSSGSAAATAAGLAAITIGTEASSVSNSLESVVLPAQANGVVAIKPTVGLVSRTGVLPVSLTQETPGAIGQTVWDVAAGLAGMAGPDASDPATSGQPSPLPDYLAGLTTTALQGRRIATVTSSNINYTTAIASVQHAGATTVPKGNVPTPSPNPADIVGREQKRDMNAYLGALPAGDPIHTLQGIVDYDNANTTEALKYAMNTLTTSNAVDLTNPTTNASYVSDRDTGLTSNRAVIDNLLNNGTPADTSDDFNAVMVPSGNALVGIADRAGYPIVTVPAGYNSRTLSPNSYTSDPVNVSFVGTAYSEARLLADAYAYEQDSVANPASSLFRQPPSATNPGAWRCIEGNALDPVTGGGTLSAFPPHSCAP